ncbi:MAG: PKD domain-containing protein, partial [Acidimicrobiia bacterium]|nr:PKD domain-containing protein [Acidimicrobiia bacterium]
MWRASLLLVLVLGLLPVVGVRDAEAGPGGEAPKVRVRVTPASGVAPLEVRFDALASSDPDGGAISVFRWDFEGDGTVDVEGPQARVSHTYGAGVYQARVTVVDDEGMSVSKTVRVRVENAVPVASLAVSYDKVSMVAPLRADFDASASSDANGTIVSYAWDFDGDGTVDDSSGPVVSHVYETAGVYTARLVVTDDLGATAEAVELVGVLANESPTAFFGVTPAVGLEAPVRVSFDASASSDPEDGTAIAYAWDFDGDGSVDSTEGPEAIHRYAAAGLYPATLTVTDSEGASSSFVRLLVVGGNAAPTVTVRTDVTGGVVPLSVFFEVAGSDVDGDEVTFELTPGDGSAAVPVGESVSHTYTATGVFSAVVTARDRAGATATATVEVTVGAAPVLGEQVRDPGVVSNVASIAAGLYEGDAPVQTGVDVDMLDPADVAIARGQVLDQAGNPLSGARVSVRDQDGFGETYSRADGWWDMAVTAGQRLTFDVAKAGFVAAQRSMEPRAGRFEIADATVLVPYDTAVTDIDFDAPIEVARGSVVTDDRGTRQQTVLFQAGTEAKMQRSDGSWETLDEISVRATEFTVGASGRAAMPGELPETVMYNYAAEFSVDEARLAGDDTASVSFSKPVFSYTDNFTGWADGTVVPCGYYNRETGFWEACENSGIALTILDATTDSDGDGIAEVTLNTDTDPDVDAGADLDGDGTDDTDIGADERETLATLYGAGTSLWRVTLQHFSPYDFNPGWIIGAAQKPDIDVDGGFDQLGKGCTMPGSVIECENQTLGETVAVAGTDSTLNYRSSRVPGRTDDRTLDISLPPDGQTVPDGVVGACLTVGVGGVGHSTGALMADSGGFWENTNWLCGGAAAVPSDDPGWEQIDATHFRFTWDGLDAYGYALNGVQDIEIRATYYYCADLTAGGFGFVDADDIITLNVDTEPNPLYGCPVAGIPTIMGQRIGHYSAPVTEFGGWSLDSHHVYDPAQGILYYGDGSFRDLDPGAANSAGAGFQMSYYADVPRDEDEDSASKVQGIAVSESEVYVGDTGTDQIWKASASSPERIAEHINVSGGLTMGGGGLLAGVYRQVMEVNTYDGSFEPYAGCIHELPPYPDCMEPSTEWSDPELVTMSPVDIEGHYVADSAGRLLVFRETDDGGVEVKELVDTATPPTAIAANAAGVYWSDGRVVYRVDSFGNVTVVAGQWDDPYGCERSEDSGLATDACLDAVHGFAVSGSMLFIADSGEAKIRAVSLNSGRIYTAAGTGVAELDPPNSCNGNYCEIWDLWPIEATDDGDVFFTDDSGTIRRLTTIAPVFDGSDIAIPSEDGSLLYQFDAYGRHLRTLDAFTLETLLTFDYESGLLSSVTDAFGRTLDIDRDWYTITLTSPDGGGSQITTLTPTGSIGGYLDTIAYPGGYSIDLTHADVADPQAGLLTGLVDPAGGNHTFFYDDDGRLYLDRAPDGGSTGLTRIPLEGTSPYEDDHYEVLVTKLHDDSPADMMVSTLTVEQGEAGTTRTFTGPDGLVTTSVADATGTVVSRVDADGTTSRVESTGDPRWGMLAPYPMSVDVDVPGRGRQSVDTARSYSYVVESGVVASATQDVTFTDADGGTRTVTSEYDWDPATAEGTVASGTPEGRTDTMTLDRYGRPVGYDPAPIDGVDQAPVAVEYDALGRVDTVSEGSRVTDYDYYTSGESPGDLWEGALKSVTDPTGRTGTVVGYDALLRPLNTQGPDGTTSGVRYDDNGNITRVLMPSSGDDHDTHVYDYDIADRPIGYNPPDIEGPDGATGATWNLDGTPDSAYDADGRSATSTYTPGTGRLDCVDYDSDAAETADVDESRDCTTVPEGAAH